MIKLCPPSYLHMLWSSLDSLVAEDIEDPGIFRELESPFTFLEYDAAVSSIKLKSAPGSDQVDYSIISSFPENFASLLLQLFNSILAEGVFPPQWKQSLITLIPKCSIHFSLIVLPEAYGKDYLQPSSMVHRIPTYSS